jgi:hypothetical protein
MQTIGEGIFYSTQQSDEIQEITLQDLLKIKENDILLCEESSFLELIEKCNLNRLRRFILINYLKTKFKHFEKVEKLSQQVKEVAKSNIFHQHWSLSKWRKQFQKIKIYIKQRIKELLLEENKNKQIVYQDINDPDNYFSTKNEENGLNEVTTLKKCTYKLKIYYNESSSQTPQKIKLSLNEETWGLFIREIKRRLGIYEFAKFRLYIKTNEEWKPLLKLSELKMYSKKERFLINELKVTPLFYN